MKSKNEISDYVNSLNIIVKDKLKVIKKSEIADSNLAKYFLSCDDDIIRDIFGDVGCNFKNFLKDLDLSHSQLDYVYDSFFSLRKPYFKKIQEIIELKKIIDVKNMHFIKSLLNQSFDYEDDLKTFINKIKMIIRNKPPVRLIKDFEKIKNIRKQKKIQTINLQIAYNKGLSYLDSLPKDFDDYIRFDQFQVNEFKQISNKIDRYKELGCNFLAEDLLKSIEGQIDQYGIQYYGFNRINLMTCALVLARFLGIEVSCNKYQISTSFFEDTWKCIHMYLDYKPKVYPYYELESLSSEYVKKVVNYLDHMPDAYGKSIFDHYAIIVPTCDIDKDTEYELIKKGILKSVLIGEKDGWCYFICFFN